MEKREREDGEADRRRAMGSLVLTCEAIAGGQFDDMEQLFAILADEMLPGDIRELAETFASMVVQIEAREFHANQLIEQLRETQRQLEAAEQALRKENKDLKQRLKKLEVQFDQEQAAQEIREIAESEYFVDLQQRAKSLRQRFKLKD
ncbi:hypothetical protein J5J10_22130 [Ciceribacter sp. L1K23]|uniref:hypothetical protein n=1 Tax=unclassified Ciceribacter TaxID=2628820 RepID=UPI001ABED81C|nr:MULTISPECIES: hypothetical protein [unclassified Ciceribacter]MBO3761691.1 hypothetical protein [Ciceribacter sp. L1K22]MBR0558403.1 hypothetical protein [Ciceribacter sp. L1K23]